LNASILVVQQFLVAKLQKTSTSKLIAIKDVYIVWAFNVISQTHNSDDSDER